MATRVRAVNVQVLFVAAPKILVMVPSPPEPLPQSPDNHLRLASEFWGKGQGKGDFETGHTTSWDVIWPDPHPGSISSWPRPYPRCARKSARRIQANLLQIAQQGVPTDESELVNQKLVVAHAMQNTTPASQAFQAAIIELYGLGFDHDRDYDQRIGAVRIEHVRQVVQRYFHSPTIVTSTPSGASSP